MAVEERIKQRLVGAIVLVALAVIFIPMILQNPEGGSGFKNALPPPPKVVQQALPAVPAPHGAALAPAPNGVALGRVQNGASAQSPASGVDKHPVAAPSGTVIPPSTPPSAASARSAPKANKGSLSRSDADQGLGAWVVQVGSFSRQDNALSLRDTLRGKGFNAFVEQASTSAGTVFRVDVGPMVKRSDADAMRAKLDAQMHLKGLVTPHR